MLSRRLISLTCVLVVLATALAAPGVRSAPLAASGACVPTWIPVGDGENFQGSVLASARGSDGFVYLAGSEALYRIEGETLRKWFANPSQPGALGSGQIRALASGEGGLWVGAGAGLSWFDFATERFEPVAYAASGRAEESVTALLVDKGVLYLGNRDGGVRLEVATRRRLGTITVPGAEQLPSIMDFEVFDGQVFAASHAGLLRIDAAGTATLVDPMASERDRPLRVYDLTVSADHGLWFAYGSGVGQLPAALGRAPDYFPVDATEGLPEGRLNTLSFDTLQRLWIGSERAISRWDLQEPHPRPCRRRPSDDYDRDLNVAVLDGSLGSYLLLGPWGGGAMIAPVHAGISRIVSGEQWNPGLPKTVVWSHHRDGEGRLTLGTSNGLYRQVRANGARFEAVAGDILDGATVLALAQDVRGRLWVGTSVGLFVEDKAADQFEPVPLFVASDGASDYVYDLVPYQDRMLAGTSQGMLLIDAANAVIEAFYRTDPVGVEAVGGAPQIDIEYAYPRIWHLQVDELDVYATSDTAVVRINPLEGRIEASSHAARLRGAFEVGRAYATTSAADGRVFVATESGLLVSDRDLETFTPLLEVNGFRLGSVYAAARGPDDTLWFGTANNGLLRYQPTIDRWQRFSRRDGILSTGMTQKSLRVLADGQIIKGGGEGVTIVAANAWAAQGETPVDLIANATNRQLSVRHRDRVEVGPRDRELTLQFSTSSALETGMMQLEYELAPGGSRQRIQLRDRVSLAQLRSGHYEFRAAMVDPSGVVSAPFSFDLDVLPRWWETSWAKAAGILLALLAAFGFAAWRTQVIRDKANLLAAERRRIAASLHDTYLQDMLGALMVSRTIALSGELEQAKAHAERISELLENASRSARSSVKALADLHEFPGLVNSLREHEAVDTFQKRKAFSLEESGEPWVLGKEREFFLSRAAREAVTNACKHARASRIHCIVRWTLLSVAVEIIDDGRGFDACADSLGAGFGLGGMRTLAHAARAHLRIDSRPGKGTTVSFRASRFAWR